MVGAGVDVLADAIEQLLVRAGEDPGTDEVGDRPELVSQVVVVGPEERGETVLPDGNAACGSGSDRDISLCYKELTTA